MTVWLDPDPSTIGGAPVAFGFGDGVGVRTGGVEAGGVVSGGESVTVGSGTAVSGGADVLGSGPGGAIVSSS